MSRPNVLQGAQNVVISNSNLNATGVVCEASYHKLVNSYLAQIDYYIGAGNRATSDAAIPVKPNSSIRFTGRTNVLAQLKEHFTAGSNDKVRCQKFFSLYGMGGIGKTQICLRFMEDMSDLYHTT